MPRARVTFHALGRTILDTDELPASDEAVKRYPDMFESSDAPVVEQATAAPGEKRSRARKAQA